MAAGVRRIGYANLAVRGRRVGELLEEQLAPALALGPDLLTIQGGGNDFLRASVDIDVLVEAIDRALRRRRSSAGACEVVLFTHGAAASWDPSGRRADGIAIFNELLREVADQHGAVLVDNWRLREARDPRYWDADRVHLSPAGHHRAAMHVLDALGIDHGLHPHPLSEGPALRPPGRGTGCSRSSPGCAASPARGPTGGWSVARRAPGISAKRPTLTAI